MTSNIAVHMTEGGREAPLQKVGCNGWLCDIYGPKVACESCKVRRHEFKECAHRPERSTTASSYKKLSPRWHSLRAPTIFLLSIPFNTERRHLRVKGNHSAHLERKCEASPLEWIGDFHDVWVWHRMPFFLFKLTVVRREEGTAIPIWVSCARTV